MSGEITAEATEASTSLGTQPSARARPLPTALTVIVLVGAVALTFLVSNYHLFQLTMLVGYALAILGLNIATGYNGQISLGHGAFYAVGA